MEITQRQKEFLDKLLDLYNMAGQPVHYTTIAEKLGISKWSAYDMMKLLEKKGLAKTEYNVPELGRGGGRSSVVFSPTQKSEEMMTRLAEGDPDATQWALVKEKILTNISKLEGTEYEKLLNEITEQNLYQKDALLYCTNMTTALLLVIRGFRDKLKGGIPVREILEETPKVNVKLLKLMGLTIGLSLTGLKAKSRLVKLLGQSKKYESMVQDMDAKRLKMLSEFLDEAAKKLLD